MQPTSLYALKNFSTLVAPGTAIGAAAGAATAGEGNRLQGASLGAALGGTLSLPGGIGGGALGQLIHKKLINTPTRGLSALSGAGVLSGYGGASLAGGAIGGAMSKNKDDNAIEKLSYEIGKQAAFEKIGIIGAIGGMGKALHTGFQGIAKGKATAGGLGGALEGGGQYFSHLAKKSPWQAGGLAAGAAAVPVAAGYTAG